MFLASAVMGMSPKQSGLYQSKVLRFVVRHTRRWVDRTSIAWRSLQTTASWSAQVLIYPVYALFQTLRVAGAKFQQARELGAQGLASEAPVGDVATPPDSVTETPLPSSAWGTITVDTPIAQVLGVVRGFSLPLAVPIGILTPGAGEWVAIVEPAAPAELLPAQATAAHPTKTELATQPQAVGVATVPKELVATAAGALVYVRGIACLRETRSLVLVTNHNQVLDILTPAQQDRLRQRIIWEVADYGRLVRRYYSSDRGFPRSLAAVQRWLLAPVRAARQRLTGRSALLVPSSDLPIQRALLAVQTETHSVHLPVLHADGAGCLHLPLAPRDRGDDQPDPIAPLTYVQGVASLLATHALVLVTTHNQVLDILSADQQDQLRQKISWEVAHYHRYLQIRHASQRAFARLPAPARDRPLLPPVRWFQTMMAWMQTGPIAIAANLFQEAALVAQSDLTAPAIATTSTEAAVTQLSAAQPLVVASASGAARAQLSKERLQAAAPESTALQPTATAANSQVRSPVAQPAYIDTPATAIGYVQPLWKQLLRWIDRCFYWLETLITRLLDWFR